MILPIVYLLLSLVVGFLGRRTFIGFWGSVIFSIFLSPVVVMLYILLSQIYYRIIQKENP